MVLSILILIPIPIQLVLAVLAAQEAPWDPWDLSGRVVRLLKMRWQLEWMADRKRDKFLAFVRPKSVCEAGNLDHVIRHESRRDN